MGGKRMFGEFDLGTGAVWACCNNVLTRLQGERKPYFCEMPITSLTCLCGVSSFMWTSFLVHISTCG